MSKKNDKQKLSLKRESLRTLSTTELNDVNGGYVAIRKYTYCCLATGGGGGGCAPAP
jgi:hypothetical protein